MDYDKLQKIQARALPMFIEEADCRLTLYRNCRNTINIATTSLTATCSIILKNMAIRLYTYYSTWWK